MTIMKKLGILVLCALMLSISCKKTTEEIIDCVLELTFTFISYTVSIDDPKQIAFSVNYDEEFTTTVEWLFGDGTSEIKTGVTTTHRYDTAGRYEVKANITLSGDHHVSCSVSKSKTVEVN